MWNRLCRSRALPSDPFVSQSSFTTPGGTKPNKSPEMAAGAVTLGLPLPSYRLSTPFPPSAPRPRNLFPKAHRRRPYLRPISSSLLEGEQQLSFTEPEAVLLESLLGIQGRGRAASPQQLQDVERAVQTLESLQGLPEPTSSSLIEGCWQLIFTTRPGTASPIQRTFVGVDFFKIFQEVYLRTDDPRVSNIVKFSDAIGELKVEAAAKIKDRRRILFQFDRAAFSFKFLPFKVPYPVPFRLLGDEAKGWLDTTYLSHNGNIRISRGNKGTTFVLQKETEPRQRLLSAISGGTGVTEVIDELVSLNPKEVADVSVTMEGEWQLLWASQMKNESWSSIAANGLKGLQIVTVDGRLENLVDPFPGFKISANGNLIRISNSNMYIVTMKDGAVSVGTLKFPLDIKSEFRMELLPMVFIFWTI
ncbi:probable plastid-lipid-associated protein 12, chloroplastic isoform X3 [Phoenix dactylifera]|uniref:Probable plastid-lipid-associated protein 12, chloroplastic isoform X3 n=1 Tax=Phoenix dactylifera TaxID=42345 RepID=A0A8B9A231_PHODC|nr:probable plastid-lipid-associated protein 12, chloroplastic isoform X3 [Phoenix dactylifera]